jgi:prepilin-type N-terminal cleavage/methylation domain-containing protein
MYARLRAARQKDDGGFTLIELLIVIVILGVLAAAVVFSVRGIQNRGQAAACKSDISTVQTAVEAHYAQAGSYTGVTAASLVTEGLLRTAPATVAISATDGAVTGTGTCAGS